MSVNPLGICMTPADEPPVAFSTVPFALDKFWAFMPVAKGQQAALLWVCMATDDEIGEEEADDCVVVLLVLVTPGILTAVYVGFMSSCDYKMGIKQN